MNGVRTIFTRKGYLLTALAAAVLLAASPGIAFAQADPTVTINSLTLSPTAVNEGEEATATLTFTVKAGTGDPNDATDNGDEVADADVTVGFAFVTSGLSTSPRATNAIAANFSGITADATNSQEFVNVAAIRGGNSRRYTASRTFRVNHDLDAENGQFKLTASVSGWADAQAANLAATPATYAITDDETQTYALSIPATNRGAIQEGGAATTVTLTAAPKRTAPATVPDLTVIADPNNPALYSFIADSGQFGDDTYKTTLSTGNAGATVQVTAGTIAALTDANREDDTVTLNLYAGSLGSSSILTDLPIAVADIHKLAAPGAITAVAKDAALNGDDVTEIVEGGDPVYLTITVDRGTAATRDLTTGEELTVSIGANSAQAGDYEVAPLQVTLPAQASGKSVTDVDIVLTALEDEDVGSEDLVLNLEVSGEAQYGSGTSTGTFSIPIVDATATKIAPKSDAETTAAVDAAIAAGGGDEGLNPGESFTVMTSDLFTTPMDGYTASYGASVSGDAVTVSVSGGSIEVNAVKAGESTVTVTATAKESMASATGSQSVSNIADVTFDVTVTDKVLTLTLDAPGAMDGNVVEGKGYDITVTANRAVMGDTEVTFMRGDMSEADVRDYSIDAVTIKDGETMATARLMVTEDMTDDAGSGMGEALHLYAMAGDTMSNTLELTIWDEAVPALPLVAQLLLALFLMASGSRLYRRHQG